MPNLALNQPNSSLWCAGMPLQDANLLKIKVEWAYQTNVPLFSQAFSTLTPLTVSTTVRMQTNPQWTRRNNQLMLD
jgi:hypothetical protein